MLKIPRESLIYAWLKGFVSEKMEVLCDKWWFHFGGGNRQWAFLRNVKNGKNTIGYSLGIKEKWRAIRTFKEQETAL